MVNHKKTCLCCHCLKHLKCIAVHNPRWTCLMPNKINEIVIGPLNPLQADCILEMTNISSEKFQILNQYVYPNFLTHMITLMVLTPTPYIIKPGHLLGKLCTITTETLLKEINGNKLDFHYDQLYIFSIYCIY